MNDPRERAEQFAQQDPPRNLSTLGFALRSGPRKWLLISTGVVFSVAGVGLLIYAVLTVITFFTGSEAGATQFPFAQIVAGLLTGAAGIAALGSFLKSRSHARRIVRDGRIVVYRVARHEERQVEWSPIEQPFVILEDEELNELAVQIDKDLRSRYYPVGTLVPVAVDGEEKVALIP